MILLISLLTQAKDCAGEIEQTWREAVELCADLPTAILRLQQQEFSAVVIDQLLLDNYVDETETLFKNLGSAAPVCVNLAINGRKRVLRELAAAFDRHKREALAAKQQAEHALREQFNEDINSLLLSCEMALRVPGLPVPAETQMHSVENLVREMSAKLAASTLT